MVNYSVGNLGRNLFDNIKRLTGVFIILMITSLGLVAGCDDTSNNNTNNNSTNNLNNTNNTNNTNNINNTNNTTCTSHDIFLCQDNNLYVRDINGCIKDDTLIEACVEGDTYCNATSASCDSCEHTISYYCGDNGNVYQSNYNGCTEVSKDTLIETCNVDQICNNSTAECECNPNYIESSACEYGSAVGTNACGDEVIDDCTADGRSCNQNTGFCFGNIGDCTFAGYVCEDLDNDGKLESVEVSSCDDRANGIDGIIAVTECQNSNFEQCIPQTGQCESMAVVYGGILWERGASGPMSEPEAETYCAGKTDFNRVWSVPNIDELRTLVRDCNYLLTGGYCPISENDCHDNSCYDSFLCKLSCSASGGNGENGRYWELGVWSNLGNDYGDDFWSITSVDSIPDDYFYLDFLMGDLYFAEKTLPKSVRCKSNDISTPQ